MNPADTPMQIAIRRAQLEVEVADWERRHRIGSATCIRKAANHRAARHDTDHAA